ncbi:MAG: hypothetical protein FJ138_10955, partial [Deltaproteobacteria bacterium]|nr:hypothetical protein [Deltaproteobacteria bacterium]
MSPSASTEVTRRPPPPPPARRAALAALGLCCALAGAGWGAARFAERRALALLRAAGVEAEWGALRAGLGASLGADLGAGSLGGVCAERVRWRRGAVARGEVGRA